MGRRYVEQIFRLADTPFDLRLTLDNCFPEIESGGLSAPAVMEDLNFGDRCPTDYETTHRFEITKSGRFDGIILWIELFADEIEPGISSMTPGSNWRPVFLPLFSPGMAVAEGDEIALEWSSRLSEDGHHPDYAVKATLRSESGTRTAELRLPRYGTADDFRQNAFYEKLFPRD
jgi:type I protein arginine methyltransferase